MILDTHDLSQKYSAWTLKLDFSPFEGEIINFRQANLQKLGLLIGLEPLHEFGSPSMFAGNGGGGQFLMLRYAYLSNMTLQLDLEPFKKLGVEEPELIMRSQRLYGGQKATWT